MGYEWLISLRYLMSKRKRMVSLITLISVAGVALGVLLLIVVLSVMGGFATDLRNKIVGTKAHVVVSAERGNLTQPEDLLAVIEEFPKVAGAAPYVETEVMISTASNVDGIVLRGIDTQRIDQVSELPRQIQEGRLDWLHDPQRARNARLRNEPEDYRDLTETLRRFRERTLELQRESGWIDTLDEEGFHSPMGLPLEPQIQPEGTSAGSSSEPGLVMPPNHLPESPSRPSGEGIEGSESREHPFVMPPIPGQEGTNRPTDEGNFAMPPIGEPRREDRITPRDDVQFVMPGIPIGESGLEPFDATSERRAIPGIVIGTELAAKLHVEVGDEVTVINPDGQILPTGPAPLSRPFIVAATFNSGLYEFDTRFAYITLSEAQDFLRMAPDEVTAIDLRLQRLNEAAQVEQRLGAALAQLGFENVLVRSWEKLNRSLFTALKLEKVAIFIILTIIILVASFSIVSNLVIMVVERASEIAILKSMGATNHGIMKVFAIEGGIIGGIGTLLGVVLGVGACIFIAKVGIPLDTEVYYIEYLPVDMELVEVLLTALAGIVISLLATVYPALKAARLNPSDALRLE